MSSGSGCQGAAGLVRERWSTRPFSNEVTPRDFAAVVEVAVEQHPGIRIVDHLRAALLELGGARHVGNRHDRAAPEPDGALVEHPGVHVNGDLAAVFDDRLHRMGKRRHVVPMSMAHRDRLHFA
jgi:hypothetical protein